MVRQSASSSKLDVASQLSRINLRFRELSAREKRLDSPEQRGGGRRNTAAGNSFAVFLEQDEGSEDMEEAGGVSGSSGSGEEEDGARRRRRKSGYLSGIAGMSTANEDRNGALIPEGNGTAIEDVAVEDGFVAVPKREKRRRPNNEMENEERRVVYQSQQNRDYDNWSSEEDDEWMENVFTGAFTRSLGYRSRKGFR